LRSSAALNWSRPRRSSRRLGYGSPGGPRGSTTPLRPRPHQGGHSLAHDPARLLLRPLALVGVGVSHLVTAWGLRPAARAGRLVHGLGGLATLRVAAFPSRLGRFLLGTHHRGNGRLRLVCGVARLSRGCLGRPSPPSLDHGYPRSRPARCCWPLRGSSPSCSAVARGWDWPNVSLLKRRPCGLWPSSCQCAGPTDERCDGGSGGGTAGRSSRSRP